MTLNKGKHIVGEIGGIRCTIVETGVTEARALFLKDLLEFNGLEVKIEKEKAKDGSPLETWVIGVTDLIFNPVIRVYQHKLFRKDGYEVTPAFWNQWPDDPDLPYWQIKQ